MGLSAGTPLASQIQHHAASKPDEMAVGFMATGEEVTHELSYGDLDRDARRVAAALAIRGAGGQRVLLCFPSGVEFLTAFVGCLYAGVVPVPIAPFRTRDAGALGRAARIAADCGAVAMICPDDFTAARDRAVEREPGLSVLPWWTFGELRCETTQTVLRLGAGEDIAFLQYTSGSTSDPKGVAVTHANLVANFAAIGEAMGVDENTKFLSWLPLHHDMGLIGMALQPLYLGCSLRLMSPLHFLQKPVRWLSAMSRYGADLSGGPNFAFDLCVRKASDADIGDLDLSAWRVAFNGAEPISAATIEAFQARFSACGLPRGAVFPCYGLAETTLFAAGSRRGRDPIIGEFGETAPGRSQVQAASGARGARLVSSGRPAAGHGVVIVRSSGEPAAPGEVGEIWLCGPSVAAGYWRPAPGDAFSARLTGDDRRFLATGDLGFLEDGELFVTGRVKDLIILRGRNIYPQDIEETAREVLGPSIAGAGAAFSWDDRGDSRVVVLQEVRPVSGRDLDAMARLIAEQVAQTHEVRPHKVALVPLGQLPRTSSGKIRRAASRSSLEAGALQLLVEHV